MLLTTNETIPLTSIELPDDLEWIDEMSWTPVAQTSTFGVTGSLYVQVGTKLAGRYITLEGKTDMGWITRETVLELITLRDLAGREMTLWLEDGRSFNVIFRQDEVPIDVKTLKGYNQFVDDEHFIVNAIRLMEVESG